MRTIALACFFTAMLAASPVWAACAQSDLAGTWFVYVIGADAEPYTRRCTVSIGADGDVGGSCSSAAVDVVRRGRVNNGAISGTVTSGRLNGGLVDRRVSITSTTTRITRGAFALTGGTLTVSPTCLVSGTIEDDHLTVTIGHAAMDRGKTVVSGVGDDGDGVLHLTAIKR